MKMMRFRLTRLFQPRLRALPAIVAVAAFALAYAAMAWRSGGFAFQRRHAVIAHELVKKSKGQDVAKVPFKLHFYPDHSCGSCWSKQARQSLQRKLDALEQERLRCLEEARWHANLAGPSFHMYIYSWGVAES